MRKILVVFDSKSGNTETMALAVAKGAEVVGNLEVTVKKAEETKNSDLLAADGIIMGSPTYFGQMSAKLKAVIDESEKIHKDLTGKVGGAFTSSGGTASGGETTLLSIVQAMLIHGMIIQGRADDKHYGVAVTGSPKKKDLAECEKLGKSVAALVLKLNSV
ncbi:MAG TPA: NAD(P)H-dependent oxidoreductase [Verrucomicrobiae bacterium]|nr:NAD(P)H-dependent oxidoreductase [Verrucomicrobiae bacterium]